MKVEKPNKKIKKLLIQATNYQKDNRLEDLEKVLKKIILIDSNYFPAFFNLGKLFEIKKKHEKPRKSEKKTPSVQTNT